MKSQFTNLRKFWQIQDSWTRLVAAAVSIRVVGGLLHSFWPITAPHTWRQVDTMATSLRYALRWRSQGSEGSDLSWWIPAVLNSGDTAGVMAMEFPLLNMWGALGFYMAGDNIDLGRSLAQLLALFAVVFLTTMAALAWQKVKDAPPQMTCVVLASAVFSFALPYTNKFMPDLPAMLLCLWGTAGLWRQRRWAVLPLYLGLLMKPTAGIVVGLMLMHPVYSSRKKFDLKVFAKHALLGASSLTLPALWYLSVCPWLRSLQEGPSLFELHSHFAPYEKLKLFWFSKSIWETIGFHTVFEFGWIPLLLGIFWLIYRGAASAKRQILVLAFIFVLQASLIGMMSGEHSVLHSYYLIGLGPTVCLMLATAWRHISFKAWHLLVGLGLIVKTGEGFLADARGSWDLRQGSRLFAECQILRTQVGEAPWGQNMVWRTPKENYPLLDLCLGERGQSETAEWGLFRLESKLPADCLQVAASDRLALVHCTANKDSSRH